MTPAAFVVLDELPSNRSGKLDRRALPEPQTLPLGNVHRGAEHVYVAPRTALETRIAGIWSEVLGIQRIGVTDNFFALGGHSLLLARVLSRIHQDISAALTMKVLFQHPTVEHSARQIDERGEDVVRLQPIPRLPRVATRIS